jgi:hypothetical protein
MISMVLLQHGKTDGIAVYIPKDTILREMAAKIKLSQHFFFDLVRELSDTPHNEELHNLYSSPRIIRMIKSRRIRWAGGEDGIGGKDRREKRPLRIPIRKWVDKIKMDRRQGGVVWNGLIWLRIGTSGGLL